MIDEIMDIPPTDFKTTIEKLQLKPDSVILVRCKKLNLKTLSEYNQLITILADYIKRNGISNVCVITVDTDSFDLKLLSEEDMAKAGWERIVDSSIKEVES